MLHQARPRRSRRMIFFSFRSIPRRCDAAGKGVPIFLSDSFFLSRSVIFHNVFICRVKENFFSHFHMPLLYTLADNMSESFLAHIFFRRDN